MTRAPEMQPAGGDPAGVQHDAPQGLARLLSAARGTGAREGVERWNPPDCGDIDMRIAADGAWLYQGTPIGRAALVRLFASILRREGERYVLVTPFEKVGIKVDDVPFLAVEMAVDSVSRRVHFRTNVDDAVEVGEACPLCFRTDAAGGFRPYVKVRGDLWARLTRALVPDLLALAEERTVDGRMMVGIPSGEAFFPIAERSAFFSEELA
ncbi:DUF1285 domain-containing protein [Pseudochelatococcus lubricantis]|uniref:DUF1285 domain-containing protein n=1 Tax=Pseudochelatococcus lubricantis TaxID=1538102 RepID=UPI0035E80C4C